MKLILASVITLMLFVSTSFVNAPVVAPAANTVEGIWKTIDDETNQPKSEVQIFSKDGKLYGKIIQLFKKPGENQDPLCDKCTGSLHNKKIIGMQIIYGLKKDGNEWEGDNGILDPNNGKFYDCKLWLDEKNPNILNVRGYIGFVYRTQTWHRVK